MGHYYSQGGAPVYYVPKAKGNGMRDTTITDARKMGLVPSVTEVLKVADKPALTAWKVNQAYLQALTTPSNYGESLEDYIKRCKANAAAEVESTADIGTEIHNACEQVFNDEPVDEKWAEFAQNVRKAIELYTGVKDGWVSEESFAHNGYGGKVDLNNRDHNIVVDFKTKDWTDPEKAPRAYDDHGMQLSAYAHGLGMPNATKLVVFVSRQDPELVKVCEIKADYYPHFKALHSYWMLSKNHHPTA